MESKSSEITQKRTGRKCLFCYTPLQGRSDKKFCDDNCRNCYHNKNKSKSRSSIKKINIILKRNFEILEKLVSQNKKIPTVEEAEILAMDFDLTYSTHSIRDKEGRKVNYCYDYGFYKIQNTYFIVRSG
jgi:predicted nucleic acid-binding Zn ribbon protein